MRLRETGDPDVIAIRSIAQHWVLLGVVLLVLGFFLATSIVDALPLGRKAVAEEWRNVGRFVVPAIVIGIACVTWRRGIVLNRSIRTATSWWGFGFPWKTAEHSLGVHHRVKLWQRSSFSVFSICLSGGEDRDIAIGQTARYRKARRIAETVAKHLELVLSDSSSGGEVVRQPEDVDRPFGELSESAVQFSRMPEPPEDMRAMISIEDEAVVIKMPRAFLHSQSIDLLMRLAAVVFILVGTIHYGLKEGDDVIGALAGTAILFGPGLMLGLWALVRAIQRLEIRASPEGLELRRYWPFPGFPKRIPASELEEFVLQTGVRSKDRRTRKETVHAQILARSDRRTLIFGECLPEEELQYVHAIVGQVLTASTSST